MSLTVRAAAKINLTLGVGPLRDDGYHGLATVYQAIGLYDDVTVTAAPSWGVSVTGLEVDVTTVPLDETNLAIQAGQLLADHHGITQAAHLHIDKGIPVAGGLAGGSADAAATLLGLDRLWQLHTPDAQLLQLAAQLGSDVPFALLGGTAYGSGHGEILEPVPAAAETWWVVVPAAHGLSTAQVYATYDELGLGSQLQRPAALLDGLAAGDVEAVAAELFNDLTAPALHLRPELAQMQAAIQRCEPAAVLLSGAGPTWLAMTKTAPAARNIAAMLLEDGISSWVALGPVAGAHVVERA